MRALSYQHKDRLVCSMDDIHDIIISPDYDDCLECITTAIRYAIIDLKKEYHSEMLNFHKNGAFYVVLDDVSPDTIDGIDERLTEIVEAIKHLIDKLKNVNEEIEDINKNKEIL